MSNQLSLTQIVNKVTKGHVPGQKNYGIFDVFIHLVPKYRTFINYTDVCVLKYVNFLKYRYLVV